MYVHILPSPFLSWKQVQSVEKTPAPEHTAKKKKHPSTKPTKFPQPSKGHSRFS